LEKTRITPGKNIKNRGIRGGNIFLKNRKKKLYPFGFQNYFVTLYPMSLVNGAKWSDPFVPLTKK
jgi:hypothetical protein